MARRQAMTTEMAVAVLNALGCDSDSVEVLNRNSNFAIGEEVEVRELDQFQFLLSPHTALASAHEIAASKVRLGYWAGRRYVEGTLLGLMLDRLKEYGIGELKPRKADPARVAPRG